MSRGNRLPFDWEMKRKRKEKKKTSGKTRKGISSFLHSIFIAYLNICHCISFYLIFILHVIYNCLFIYCICCNCMMSIYFIFNLSVQTWEFLGAWQTPGSTTLCWDSILITIFLCAFRWLALWSSWRWRWPSWLTHSQVMWSSWYRTSIPYSTSSLDATFYAFSFLLSPFDG